LKHKTAASDHVVSANFAARHRGEQEFDLLISLQNPATAPIRIFSTSVATFKAPGLISYPS
jgi:hypothetical protein